MKKDVGRALLLKGSLFVHLDPRVEGVVVPVWLRNQPQLVLQVGLDMPVPIPDLRVDAKGVFGTLSFKGQAFTCIAPWDAVFALVGDDGRGMVWPESMPPEIASEVEREVRRKGLDPSLAGGRSASGDAEHLPQPASALALDDDGDDFVDPPEPRKLRKPLSVVRNESVDAVIAAEEAEAADHAASAEDDDEDGDAKDTFPEPPAAARRKSKANGKPKKPLPPYLRVVK